MSAGAHILFHGVRGSAPVSGVQHADFGGDTPAAEIVADGARLFIDAGSGLRNASVGAEIADDTNLILSHYHYDHLIGLPFFEPAWRLTGRLRIWAPRFDERAPRDILNAFYAPPYCPVRLSDLRMRVEVVPYRPGEDLILSEQIEAATALLNHPGGSAALRISTKQGDIVYASDAELADDDDADALASFAQGARLMVVDAMNNDSNAAARRGWGHSSWRQALAVGAAADAGEIALFHHDPRADDDLLAAVDAEVRVLDPRAFLLRQGADFRLHSSAAPIRLRDPLRGERTPWRCSR